MRGQRLVRTLMLTPWIVPSFVVATLWQFMWQSDVGIVNKVLVDYTGLLGERPVWLSGDNSLWAIIIPSVWRGLPFAMLIFLAGLQAIPPELHEAAAIDGAGPWRRFRHITLPLLRPLIAIQLLFGVIYAAYQYAIPVVMLGSNPGPDADLMMTLIVRQSFSNNLFGFGAAASVLLMARDARLGGASGTAPSAATWRPPHDRARTLAAHAPAARQPRARRADLARAGRDARADRLAVAARDADQPAARDRRATTCCTRRSTRSRRCGRRSTSSATSSTA